VKGTKLTVRLSALHCILFAACAFAGDVAPLPATRLPDTTAIYVLHPDDEIVVHSLEAKEASEKTFRLDQKGEVNVPLVGIVHLGGQTIREAETQLSVAYKKFYLHPDIAISMGALHTEPVSVLGSVGTPGVYQLKGQTHLLEALSAAGGVREDALQTVIITRQEAYGRIPHPDARQKLTGESIVEINLKELTESQNVTENFLMEPHDVVSIPPAQLVYVLGHVKKSGGFVLGGKPELSVLQALALAEGFDPQASPARAQILRRGGNKEQQIAVNMKKILAGKDEDLILHPNDILYIPSSTMKTVTTRTIETAISVGTGILVFRR